MLGISLNWFLFFIFWFFPIVPAPLRHRRRWDHLSHLKLSRFFHPLDMRYIRITRAACAKNTHEDLVSARLVDRFLEKRRGRRRRSVDDRVRIARCTRATYQYFFSQMKFSWTDSTQHNFERISYQNKCELCHMPYAMIQSFSIN